MVTDIKGVGYCLCDLEIPSVQQVYVEDNSISSAQAIFLLLQSKPLSRCIIAINITTS